MKIAIVGTGIAGLTCAHLLHRDHELTVFEAEDWIGGHTHTVTVPQPDGDWPVDTGFIVCNDHTYPNFRRLLDELGVSLRPTTMGFSVRCERTDLEYSGNSFNALLAQRANVLRPRFWRMVADILRFYRQAPAVLANPDPELTLGAYLEREGYSAAFRDHFIVPMGAAIWSASVETMLAFPLVFFVRFFHNHGMLTVRDVVQWYTVEGGSARYVEVLTAPFRDRIRLATAVRRIRRLGDAVEITAGDDSPERFDQVIVAAHSDQALAMLADPTDAERDILGAIAYQPNDVVLHTDAGVMPTRRLAWSAWNYHLPANPSERATVSYNMNILQGLESRADFIVSLNYGDRIDPQQVLARFTYDHPVYSRAVVAAQERHAAISGVGGTHYCGAYWRYGFHEDGVVSALRVCRVFGRELAGGNVGI